MVFTQIFVPYESVQYKGSAFTILLNESLYGKIKMSVTSAYIECATGNWYHRIELNDSFLLKYILDFYKDHS